MDRFPDNPNQLDRDRYKLHAVPLGGRQIDAVVEVNGLPKSDAKVLRHNAEEHILIIGDEDYFLREKEVGLGAGPFWGEYFGSIYTKSDGIYAEFPPSVKTEPWDPKPKRIEASDGTLRAIEFVSITNKRIRVKFME